MVKSDKSSQVRAGKSTYFFDVNTASNNKKYLRITESRFVEEGKDRVRNSVVIFPEQIDLFSKNVKDMAAYLA